MVCLPFQFCVFARVATWPPMLHVGNYTSVCSKIWAWLASDEWIHLEKIAVRKFFYMLSTLSRGRWLGTLPEPAWLYLLYAWYPMKCNALLNLWHQKDFHLLLLIRISLNFQFGRLSARNQNFVDFSFLQHLAYRDAVPKTLASCALFAG